MPAAPAGASRERPSAAAGPGPGPGSGSEPGSGSILGAWVWLSPRSPGRQQEQAPGLVSISP